MLGVNFYAESPRFLEMDAASALVAALPPVAQVIGVFVDPLADDVFRAMDRFGLSAAQLHGDETPEVVSAIARRYGPRPRSTAST